MLLITDLLGVVPTSRNKLKPIPFITCRLPAGDKLYNELALLDLATP